jgi:hypothetical protein
LKCVNEQLAKDRWERYDYDKTLTKSLHDSGLRISLRFI